jgi:hypothetical protein
MLVRLQVLTAARTKTILFWDVPPCRLVALTDVSDGIIFLMMEAARLQNVGKLLPDYTGNIPDDIFKNCLVCYGESMKRFTIASYSGSNKGMPNFYHLGYL